MKKEYIFVILIVILLYMFYLVLSYKYTEYRINSNIEYLSQLTQQLENRIDEAKGIIEYKSSLSYRNKVLKEEQGLKNK